MRAQQAHAVCPLSALADTMYNGLNRYLSGHSHSRCVQQQYMLYTVCFLVRNQCTDDVDHFMRNDKFYMRTGALRASNVQNLYRSSAHYQNRHTEI